MPTLTPTIVAFALAIAIIAALGICSIILSVKLDRSKRSAKRYKAFFDAFAILQERKANRLALRHRTPRRTSTPPKNEDEWRK